MDVQLIKIGPIICSGGPKIYCCCKDTCSEKKGEAHMLPMRRMQKYCGI